MNTLLKIIAVLFVLGLVSPLIHKYIRPVVHTALDHAYAIVKKL